MEKKVNITANSNKLPDHPTTEDDQLNSENITYENDGSSLTIPSKTFVSILNPDDTASPISEMRDSNSKKELSNNFKAETSNEPKGKKSPSIERANRKRVKENSKYIGYIPSTSKEVNATSNRINKKNIKGISFKSESSVKVASSADLLKSLQNSSIDTNLVNVNTFHLNSVPSSMTTHSDDSISAINQNSNSSGDAKRYQVEKALDFLELVRKKYLAEPQIYHNFLNLMRSFKKHRFSDENISLKDVVDKVKTIFKDNTDLFECFSKFVLGDSRYSENMRGLITAADNLPGTNCVVLADSGAKKKSLVNHHASTSKKKSTTSSETVSPKECTKHEQFHEKEILQKESVKLDFELSKLHKLREKPQLNSCVTSGKRTSGATSSSKQTPRVPSSLSHQPVYGHNDVNGPNSTNHSNSNSGNVTIVSSLCNQHGSSAVVTPSIPSPLTTPYGTYPNYSGQQPNSLVVNRYILRHHNVPLNSIPTMIPNAHLTAGRDTYHLYKNTTSSNGNSSAHLRYQTPQSSSFTPIQSAIYHNVTNCSVNITEQAEGVKSSKASHSYSSSLANKNTNSTETRSSTAPSSPSVGNSCANTSCTVNSQGVIFTTSNNGNSSTNVLSSSSSSSHPYFYQENADNHSQIYCNTMERQDSFDRGAFDFVSAVKIYFTDVLKKPNAYQDFIKHLRDYQVQHEMCEMSTVLRSEEKKKKENDILKSLMGNVSGLFNNNAELINSFLYYLPSLNSSLSSGVLAPYYSTPVTSKSRSFSLATGTVINDGTNPVIIPTHMNYNPCYATTSSATRTATQNEFMSHANATTSIGIDPTKVPTNYSTIIIANKTNSQNKFVATPNAPSPVINVQKHSYRQFNLYGSNPIISNSVCIVRGNNIGNHTGVKSNFVTVSSSGTSSDQLAPQTRMRAPYNHTAVSINNYSAALDPNFIQQIFTEIKAVTTVKDYSNFIRCINLYNNSIITFSELLYLVKSIAHNNKIAYSKMRLIFKSLASSYTDIDHILPEIIYPGSDLLLKNRVYRANVDGSVYGNINTGNSTLNALPLASNIRIIRSATRQTTKHNPNTQINVANYINNSSVPVVVQNNNGHQRRHQAVLRCQQPLASGQVQNSQRSSRTVTSTAKSSITKSQSSKQSHNYSQKRVMVAKRKTTTEMDTFIKRLSETHHARYYLDRNQSISSSYFLLSESAPSWVCSGVTKLAESVLNYECLSEAHTLFEEKTTNSTTPAAVGKNAYEEELTRVEEERFELDMLLDLVNCVFSYLKNLYNNQKIQESSDIIDSIFNDRMKFFIYKILHNLYGDNFRKAVSALKTDYLSALSVLLPRLEQKIKEWERAKLHLEVHWRKIVAKNYLKALDYQYQLFKTNELKKIKGKYLLKEIESMPVSKTDINEPLLHMNKNKCNIVYSTSDDNTNINDCNTNNSYETIHSMTIDYINKNIISTAVHLIMYYAKRQSNLTSDDKGHVDRLIMHEFLPKLFSPSYTPDPDTNSNCISVHLYACDDMYIFFRLHHILSERLYEMYKICQEVFAASEAYKIVDGQLINLANQNSTLCENDMSCRYPFLLSKSTQHKFSSKRRATSLTQLHDYLVELIENLLDGTIDNDRFEDECRFIFGTKCYVIFGADKIVQECVKHLNSMIFNSPSRYLIDCFMKHYSDQLTNNKEKYCDCLENYKDEMDTIMKSYSYYYKLIFTTTNNQIPMPVDDRCASSVNVSCKIMLYQLTSSTAPKTIATAKSKHNKNNPIAVVATALQSDKTIVSTSVMSDLVVQGKLPDDENMLSTSLNTNNDVIMDPLATEKSSLDVKPTPSSNISCSINYEDWRNYVSYFTRNDAASNDNTLFDHPAMDLNLLNREINFAQEKNVFLIRNLRCNMKRMPKMSSQIVDLIKHLSKDDILSNVDAMISENLSGQSTDNSNQVSKVPQCLRTPFTTLSIASNNDTTNESIPGDINCNRDESGPSVLSNRRLSNTKVDEYSNGLIIFDNETYALEPVAFKMQFLRESQYFLYNEHSAAVSLKNYKFLSSTVPSHGSLLEKFLNPHHNKRKISILNSNVSIDVNSDSH